MSVLDFNHGNLPTDNKLRFINSLQFATVKAEEISGCQPAEVANLGKLLDDFVIDYDHELIQGNWIKSGNWNTILDPLNGESFIRVSEIDESGIKPFVESLSKCPKHGLHNPFKSPERYLMYGDISAKAGYMLSQPEVSNFFAKLVQRVSPKSYQQAFAEVYVTGKFLENFSGDQVRFLARSFGVPGNHLGQQSHGFRWPYGPVALITPFNFPLEIPVLQLMGALYMGNKPVLKVDSKVSIVMEQMLRLLHACGMPAEDVDFINSDGPTMNKLLLEANPRMTLFTGSSRIANKLAYDLNGRVKLEDAGFDWKILGPDVQEVDYVSWVCDQDAYACSGQKCSAQSLLFVHENWGKTSLMSQLSELAGRRKLDNLTIGPVLTVTTKAMLDHKDQLLKIPGSKLIWGGEELPNHSIPSIYGAIKPTAVFVPLEQILKPEHYDLVTKEIFGPFQVRFLARSFGVPGNHLGQQSHGFRWPYGPVALITPFNFPLEIPVLQLMGALYMGNKPVLKVDSKVSIVMEQMLRLLHACGMPAEDVDFINSDGPTMNKLLLEANPRMTLFTGSSRIANKLAYDLNGRVKLEDAGFDWKILGPDVQEVDYVSWVCDQDAYACSGQKCSAQSLLFVHENWGKTSLMSQLSELAGRRKLDNLTIGPVLTVTTKAMLDHKDQLLKIPGSKLIWGGEELPNHSIPSIYGAIKPTAVFVPLEQILKPEHYDLVTKEIFGPFQIVTEYKDSQVPMVLEALERMHAHLTAAVVSNDPLFVQGILGNTVNGTTYAGLGARTTGAPQNHWFGPAGDPRGAGIGTPEAIKLVWSCHREVIYDFGPVPHKWQIPPST
ncbi:aldehyde/histidinol dehydrogenase [Artemisia annua]|uniref:Aldehyde/histidinol dehydrogenase n=1 Tax=Artemisia annua TaxID=35608 RepID=A0A2U1M3S4_ARTAN|nr:aldehyde/histidinol dehydrogenase [Artemisia annua]